MRRKTCARHGKSRWKIVTFRLISSNVPRSSSSSLCCPFAFSFVRDAYVATTSLLLSLPTYPLATIVALSPFSLSLSLYLSLTRPSLFSRLSVRAPSLCRDFHFYLHTSVSPRDSTVGSVITYVDVAVHDECRTAMAWNIFNTFPFRHREFPSRVLLYLSTN